MLKIEKTVTASPEQWEIIIEGMRNPKNSWGRMDSMCLYSDPYNGEPAYEYVLGSNDHKLMDSLNEGGPVHAKYRRMIPVWVTITAPLYWWKEFETYKVGTVCNSCSTMHKIHAKEFTLEDFSCEHLMTDDDYRMNNFESLLYEDTNSDGEKTAQIGSYFNSPLDDLKYTIDKLNLCRRLLLDKTIKGDRKVYWWQMIQLLPTSYNQKRTIMLNYEVLVNIYKWRKDHKLDEWHTFCEWIKQLPYSELITMEDYRVEFTPATEPRPDNVPNGIVRTKEEIANGSAQA